MKNNFVSKHMNTYNRSSVFKDRKRSSKLSIKPEDQYDLNIELPSTIELFDEYFLSKENIVRYKKYDDEDFNDEINTFLDEHLFPQSAFRKYIIIVDYRFFVSIAKTKKELKQVTDRLNELTSELNKGEYE